MTGAEGGAEGKTKDECNEGSRREWEGRGEDNERREEEEKGWVRNVGVITISEVEDAHLPFSPTQ